MGNSLLHIMVDLETMATPSITPCPLFFSIGAVKFDPNGSCIVPPNALDDLPAEYFYRLINPLSAEVAGLSMDQDTVEWWAEQSQEAKQEWNRSHEVGCPLRVVLSDFQGWVKGCTHIWSHGLDFDIAILRAAYAKIGQAFEFNRHGTRDTRTFFDGVPGYKKEKFFPDVLIEHHAVWDAWRQAVAVQKGHAVRREYSIPITY